MDKKSTFLAAAGLAALTLAIAPADAEADKGREKCYGVVKAGKNDCGSADGAHSCAGQAKTDGSPNEWVIVPEGLCERLVGGSLEPGKKG